MPWEYDRNSQGNIFIYSKRLKDVMLEYINNRPECE